MSRFRLIAVCLAVLLSYSTVAFGDVADPTPVTVMTSSGVMTLIPKGDEHGHWLEDESGNEYIADENGVFIPSGGHARQKRLMQLQQKSVMAYTKNDFGIKVEGFEAKGEVVIPVVLAFYDQFTVHEKAGYSSVVDFYDDYLNNCAGSTFPISWQVQGSLRDYWSDNSMDAFKPRFKIFTLASSKLESCGGVLSAKRTLEWYGKNDSSGKDANDYQLFKDAVSILKSSLSSDSQLTKVNGGKYASILIIYPGCGENDDSSRPNLIWPCAWNDGDNYDFSSSGLKFQTLALINELTTKDKPDMGTLCHEFGHCVGLPDFYDVDKDANGKNAYRVGSIDLMDGGSSKIIPPPLTCVERYLYFNKIWPNSYKDVTQDYSPYSRITLLGISRSGDFMMFTSRNNPKEFLFVEAHDGYKWDNVIGLYFYHVDMSSNKVSVNSSKTAADLWANNWGMNNYDGHSCYRNAHKDKYGCRPYDYSGKAFGIWFSNYYNSGGKISVNYVGNTWGSDAPGEGKVRICVKFYSDYNGVDILDDVVVACNGKPFDDSRCKPAGLKGIYELDIDEREFSSSSFSITVSKPGYETKVISKDELEAELNYISENNERTDKNPGYVFFACKLNKDDTPVYSSVSYPLRNEGVIYYKTPSAKFSLIQRIPVSVFNAMSSSRLDSLCFPSLVSSTEGLEYELGVFSGNTLLFSLESSSSEIFSSGSKQLFPIPESGELIFRLDFKGTLPVLLPLSYGTEYSLPAEIIDEHGIVSLLPGTLSVKFTFLLGASGQTVPGVSELFQGIRLLNCGFPEARYKLYSESVTGFVRFSVNGKDYSPTESFLLMEGLNRLELFCEDGNEYVSWIYFPL